jgi:hypothetical protein
MIRIKEQLRGNSGVAHNFDELTQLLDIYSEVIPYRRENEQ